MIFNIKLDNYLWQIATYTVHTD